MYLYSMFFNSVDIYLYYGIEKIIWTIHTNSQHTNFEHSRVHDMEITAHGCTKPASDVKVEKESYSKIHD